MYNLYVDESCHLERDHFPVMCIGYTKCATDDYLQHKESIKKLKLKFKSPTEIKWTNISKSRLPLYKSIVDYFFDNSIDFRCILVKYKDKLDHEQFNQGSHDNFYYKLIYHLLKAAVNPPDTQYRVYLDVKDTRGKERLVKIQQVLSNTYKNDSPFVRFQHIHSDENVLMQITDLLIGALTYKNRHAHINPEANSSKIEMLSYIEEKSGYSLDEGTEPWESKFNIFDHQPKDSKK